MYGRHLRRPSMLKNERFGSSTNGPSHPSGVESSSGAEIPNCTGAIFCYKSTLHTLL